jgi:FAD/FMN-containing dehydrogenase
MLNPCTPDFLATLPAGTVRAPDARHLDEPRGRWTGQAGGVALPRSVDEVAQVVRACAAARVGIVPWGGGTGLVGGQVMPGGPAPLLLSLERMAGLRGAWAEESAMAVEAGMTLARVQAAAEGIGGMFPLTLASEGTATIGGNLATNAGGTHVLRYGNVRALCLGVEAVLADGSVHHGLTRLHKDNAGYALRDLLIGSEGTLGIITAATLRVVPRPAEVAVALLAVPSPAAALALLALAEGRLPGLVSAFELISGVGLGFLAETMPEVRVPLVAPWSVLVELGLPAALPAAAAMEGLAMAAAEAGLATDAVIAASGVQAAQFWAVREAIPLANRRIGAVSSHDISLPLSALPAFIDRADAAIAGIGAFRVNCFGHLGDGNLHYNVFPVAGRSRADHEGQREAVKTAVHDLVAAMGGSVAAEHGVGRLKVADLERYGDPAKLAAMRAIKAALDPLGILNPGAVLRQG